MGKIKTSKKKKKRKESITRVGHSRNDLVDFFGRGLGSKKIHIIRLETDLEQKHNTCMELYCFNPDDHSGASARASVAQNPPNICSIDRF